MESCLICQNVVPIKTEEDNGNVCKVLDQNLQVIFILRNVLQVPREKLIRYLKEYPEVTKWILVCETCEKLVRKCWTIWEETCKLLAEFRGCQKAIQELIRGSSEEVNLNREENRSGRNLSCGRERILRESHDFARNYSYGCDSNPFLEGDRVAECKEIVKDEPVDDELDNEDGFRNEPCNESDADDNWHPSDSDLEQEDDADKTKGLGVNCPTCGKYIKNKCSLKIHMDIMHLGKLRSCHLCSEKFKYVSSLEKHLFRVHQIDDAVKRFLCAEEGCGKIFMAKKTLVKHMARYHRQERNKNFTCSSCGKAFMEASSMRRHKRLYHDLDTESAYEWQCDLCPYKTRYKENLKTHNRILHDEQNKRVRPYSWKPRSPPVPCPRCGILFGPTTLPAHLRHQHNEKRNSSKGKNKITKRKEVKREAEQGRVVKPKTVKEKRVIAIPCSLSGCPEVFPTIKARRDHLKSYHKERPFSCKSCDKTFFSSNGLYRHRRNCSSTKTSESQLPSVPLERSFVCETCGKSFLTIWDLTSHRDRAVSCKKLRMPEDEATEMCEICGRKCPSKYSLARHIREVHEGKWRHYCEYCGKGVENRSKLLNHLAKAHGIGEERKCVCPEEGCGKVLSKAYNLKWHLAAVHKKGEAIFSCEDCGKTFNTPNGVSQHKRVVHKGYRYKPKDKKINCSIKNAILI